ncbi:MAG: glycine oxidase ThiO [Persicimonas sp.]
MKPNKSTEIAIVGAGVAGLGVGWKLAQAGRQVTIFERGEAGSGASRAAAGMLAPTAEVTFEEEALLRLGQKSLAMYPDFVAELEEASGLDVDYRSDGTLMVALDADDAGALDHVSRYHRELGLTVDKLDAERARELEPGLAPNLHSALFIASDHQVDPRRLTAALAEAFVRAGGRLVEHTPVARIECDERVEAVVIEAGERIACDRVLVAAGAWTPQIDGLARGVLPYIRPVRGQMLAVGLGEPALCRHVIRAPDAYLVPKSDGRLIVGATSEEMGFDPELTAGGVFELLRGAWEVLPGIYDQHLLDMWTGFRPVTLDNLPVLGPSEEVDGLWFATGHGRNGILLTPITAHEVARAILDGRPSDALAGFTPARFAR